MKKLFALIFAAVLFAGCSNNVDNNDAAKFALFSRQNNTEKYSLKINLFAEQSRTITPFDSDEAYVNAVSKVEKWDLVFTDINDESNNFSVSQLQAQNGVLLVKTGKTGNFKVEISGSTEIDGTTYNFYGFIPSVGLSNTPGETLEFSAPVGLAKAGGTGNFSGKVTLDGYWEISNKEFSAGGVPGDLFKILLVSKTNNETIELTPEYDSITDQSGFFTGFVFNKNDIPSDYYQLKVSFSGYNGKKSVDEVVFDKGNLVVIGDGLTTHAELSACYSQPVTQIVDTYYACNDKDSQGNGLYPQTKGYAWGIIKNIFEYTEKEAGTYTVYCDAFVIDAVEYKALKGISSKNSVEVNILYSNGKCTIKYNNDTGYSLHVERCFAVSAKDFVGTEAEPFPVLEIDEHSTKNLYTSITYENFVAVVLKVTDFAGINPRNTKINYYINDTETFLYNTPFFVYNSDPEFTSFEQNYDFVYIKRNGEYQYAPSYRLRLFTDDNLPEGYKKLYETAPDAAANYKQFYLSVKPSVQFIDPEQKYFIGSNSKTEGDYIIYAPKHKFQIYADSNCENPVNDDKLTYTWYLNGKDVSAITGNNSFVVLSEEYDNLNLYGENNIECIITDGSIMKTADKTFKFSMPVEQRAALYHAKDSDYSILKYYNTVSGMTYNTNIKIKDVKDYYTTWFFMDGTSLFYEEVDSVGSVTYRTQALNGEFVEMPFNDSLEGLISSLNKQYSLNSLTKDVATGKIWLYHSDDTEKITRLSVIENPNDEDCKVISYAMLNIYDPGACIAVYNDKVYVFRTTNEIDIYSVEKDTRKGLKFSEKTTVNTGIPLLFENPRVMDFAVVPVVPYNGGVRAVVCISQIFDNMFTPEDFTEGSTHEMYSLGSVSSFDLDESGNISNLKSNLGYKRNETGYLKYQNNNLLTPINYQINFIVSDSENVDGIPVIFGKTKILAIKEDEVILSDVGVYSYDDSGKKRLGRKSHLVKYDFKTLCDLASDVNISFDINNISGSIGEWHTDIWE
ncbi:MAG: hypothetical protein MSH22_02785 [Spirochaetia bacterium]|nr:hypothetical protein [Spirochaetia bacterium]